MTGTNLGTVEKILKIRYPEKKIQQMQPGSEKEILCRVLMGEK